MHTRVFIRLWPADLIFPSANGQNTMNFCITAAGPSTGISRLTLSKCPHMLQLPNELKTELRPFSTVMQAILNRQGALVRLLPPFATAAYVPAFAMKQATATGTKKANLQFRKTWIFMTAFPQWIFRQYAQCSGCIHPLRCRMQRFANALYATKDARVFTSVFPKARMIFMIPRRNTAAARFSDCRTPVCSHPIRCLHTAHMWMMSGLILSAEAEAAL